MTLTLELDIYNLDNEFFYKVGGFGMLFSEKKPFPYLSQYWMYALK